MIAASRSGSRPANLQGIWNDHVQPPWGSNYTTNINTEILSSMMDAFASIISNNLNGVMKGLAAITIIINVPAVVAAYSRSALASCWKTSGISR